MLSPVKSPSLFVDSQLSSYLEYHATLYSPDQGKDTPSNTPLSRRHYIQYETFMERLKNEMKAANDDAAENLVREIIAAVRRDEADGKSDCVPAATNDESKNDQSINTVPPPPLHSSHVSGHGLTILSPDESVASPHSEQQSLIRNRRTNATLSYGSTGGQKSPGTSASPRIVPQTSDLLHPLLVLLQSDLVQVHECYIEHLNVITRRFLAIERVLARIDQSENDILDLMQMEQGTTLPSSHPSNSNFSDTADLNLSIDPSRATLKKQLQSTFRYCRFIENYCQLNRTVLKQICKQLHISIILYYQKHGNLDISLRNVHLNLPQWAPDDTHSTDDSSLIDPPTTHQILLHFSPPQITPFSTLEGVEDVMNRVHSLYTQYYCASNPDKALSQLNKTQIKHNQKDIFKFAYTMGFLGPLVIFLLGLLVVPPSTIEIKGFWDVFPVFRALFLIILYIWWYGLDVYIWQKRKINHQYILELDPSATLDHIKVWKTAATFTIVWAIYFLLYLGHAKSQLNIIPIDVKWYPLAAIATMTIICVLPVHLFHLGARLTILKVLQHLFILPFGQCKFVHNFAADVLTSMAVPLGDISYSICYYTTNAWNEHSELNQCREWNTLLGPCLVFWPYYWRLLQCLRVYHDSRQKAQLINAGKYFFSLMVIVLNALHSNIESSQQWGVFRIFWIVVVIFSTLYSYTWDITMDWGLLQVRQGTLLRPKLMYPKLYYVALAIFNLAARFAWAGTLATYISNRMTFLTIIFGGIEISRRAMWSTVRLEWAQISNAEKYRKSRFVPEEM
mmetsp:Transcript_9650/g.35802  ORF Transcript_9650/g.35802 Transcript_9650/m.35802 type:complete len:791 (-) Transcript_9650:25-2397(-)